VFSKKQAEPLYLFSREAKHLKPICACTEGYLIVFGLQKNYLSGDPIPLSTRADV
jgi:hypothetical protein